MRSVFKTLFLALAIVSCYDLAFADERHFVYSYEAEVLPKGGLEFEQWITARAGREGGDFNQWEFREELEYGLTDELTTALYLNFKDVYFHPNEAEEEAGSEEEENFEFAGISSEWKYQLMNPNVQPVGLVAYLEGTIDSDEAELEEKIILSSNIGEDLIVAFNVALEQEWEYEGSETEEEGKIDSSIGVAYKLHPNWSVGVEMRNLREYEGFNYDDELLTAWYVGPNVHYGAATWWATLAAMPQIGLEKSRNLEDAERVNVRLIVGKNF